MQVTGEMGAGSYLTHVYCCSPRFSLDIRALLGCMEVAAVLSYGGCCCTVYCMCHRTARLSQHLLLPLLWSLAVHLALLSRSRTASPSRPPPLLHAPTHTVADIALLQVLNAKPENVERESEIVAQSGRRGAVTISTNMAGRGTDILLGGNPDFLARLKLRELLLPEVVAQVGWCGWWGGRGRCEEGEQKRKGEVEGVTWLPTCICCQSIF